MVFIDSNFCCHLINDGTMRELQTNFFNGKCKEFIEGYRFIPDGENWTRDDGVVFRGETVFPWKDYEELDQAQRQYEKQQLEETKTALEIILGEVEV